MAFCSYKKPSGQTITKLCGKLTFKVSIFFNGPSDCCCAYALTGYLGFKSFTVKKVLNNHIGWILMPDIAIDNDGYILINLFNANNEKYQVNTLINPQCLLKESNADNSKQIVLVGNLSQLFWFPLEAIGGKSWLNQEISRPLDMENPSKKSYTFR